MIVEFFGFPGSGKTTICNRFIKKLEKDGKKVARGTFDHLGFLERIIYKLTYSVLCFFVTPVFYIKNIFCFLGIRKGTKMSFSDFLNITYLFARYFMYKNTDKIVVFDQGLIQAYWSILIFAKGGKEYNYDFLFKNVDVVIVLEIDLEQNMERLLSREDKSSRIQQKTANMEFYFKNFLMLKEALAEMDIPYKLYIDSGEKVKKNVKKIKKEVIKNKKA